VYTLALAREEVHVNSSTPGAQGYSYLSDMSRSGPHDSLPWLSQSALGNVHAQNQFGAPPRGSTVKAEGGGGGLNMHPA